MDEAPRWEDVEMKDEPMEEALCWAPAVPAAGPQAAPPSLLARALGGPAPPPYPPPWAAGCPLPVNSAPSRLEPPPLAPCPSSERPSLKDGPLLLCDVKGAPYWLRQTDRCLPKHRFPEGFVSWREEGWRDPWQATTPKARREAGKPSAADRAKGSVTPELVAAVARGIFEAAAGWRGKGKGGGKGGMEWWPQRPPPRGPR